MDDRYCIDNGAMIAYAGVLEYLHTYKKIKPGENIKTLMNQRPVDVFGTSDDGMKLKDCTFT